jgi:type VI secretion system secreted protein VgrG
MDFDPTKKLLALEISFEGTHDAEWSCSASAVFATEPYRPPHKTPKPTIQGLQSAIVVGPKGQEIYTDEHGRVRVQFHWDRAAPFDDQSSLWMRVSYGWAGGGYGLIALPRVGHEVLVAFLEGDPDLPVVVGRVHGETTQVPHRLPESKTASAWRSASTPGGDGFNELLFEDAKGKELVYMQAERDMRRLVKRDETAITERNRLETIGVNAVKLVGRNETETIGMNRAVVIGSNLTETMGGDRVVNIGGGHTENVAKGLGITVGPQPPPPAPSGGGEPAPPPAPEIPAGVMKLDVKERLEITCGESKIVLDKSGKVEIIGTEFEFTASGHVGINGSIIDLN